MDDCCASLPQMAGRLAPTAATCVNWWTRHRAKVEPRGGYAPRSSSRVRCAASRSSRIPGPGAEDVPARCAKHLAVGAAERPGAGPRRWRPGRPGPAPGSGRGPPRGPGPGRSAPNRRSRRRRVRRNRGPRRPWSTTYRLFSAAAARTMRRATESAPPTCCTDAPSGFEVRARRTRPSRLRREVKGRAERSKPRYGLSVTESAARADRPAATRPRKRHGGADVAALGVGDAEHPPPPRPPQGPVPALAMPAEPCRSRAPPAASPRQRARRRRRGRSAKKRSSPRASSARPQRCSSAGCGSTPTQSGPRSAMARPSRGAEGLPAGPCQRQPQAPVFASCATRACEANSAAACSCRLVTDHS